MLAEQRPRHHAGGIVDAADQAQRRAVGTEPAVWTAVGLHQQAGLRHALASSAVVGWAACSGAAHTLAEQQLAHGGSPQEQSLVVELLGQVLLVETSVLMLRQLEDPGAHLWRQRLPRLPTAIAVHQSTGSVGLVATLEPTQLTDRYAEQHCGLFGAQRSCQ